VEKYKSYNRYTYNLERYGYDAAYKAICGTPIFLGRYVGDVSEHNTEGNGEHSGQRCNGKIPPVMNTKSVHSSY